MALVLRDLRFSYEPSLRLLVDDFTRLLNSVEPVDAHLGVYSHRSYELLLRACTEFESLSKDALVCAGSSIQPSKMNINHFRELEQHVPMECVQVGLMMWRPTPVFVAPFSGWSDPSCPVSWYRDYNLVKHNRSNEFHRATLGNVRLAIAAVVALMRQTHVPDISGVQQSILTENGSRTSTLHLFPYSHFSLRVPT